MLDVRDVVGLVDYVFDCKELGFSGSDVDYMVNCFDDQSVVQVDMWYGGSNIISYTSIWDNYYRMRISGSADSDIVKVS